jgi:hypothetical protein
MATYNRFTIAKPDEKKAVTTANRFTVQPDVIPANPIPLKTETNQYKSPSSISYKPEPIIQKGLDTIQSVGAPIAKDVISSPFVQGAQKAGAELAGEIRKPIQGVIAAGQATQQAPLKVLNHPVVSKAMVEVAKRTSGTGIQSMVEAIGPKTFQDAYDANRAYQAGDPSKLNQFWYQLKDSGPQTLFGVALNFAPFGTGPALSTAYWTALSAADQIENKGSVTSLGNIGIDVLGDRILGNSIEAMFKAPAKSLLSTVTRNFVTEGGTEVAQDLLKMQNDYNNAKTPEEKAKILEDAKKYFTSGQILMTFGVGGIMGAGIGTAAYTINQTLPKPTITDEEKGKIIVPPPPPDGPGGSYARVDNELGPKGKDEFVSGKPIDIVLDNNKTIDVAKTESQLPPVQDGFERFYRAESPTIKHSDAWGEQGGMLPTGFNKGDSFHLTPDIKYADYYKSTYGKDAKISYFDLPKGLAKPSDKFEGEFTVNKTQLSDIWDKSQTITDNEASAQGPGFKKMSSGLDQMVKTGTIFPEDATILKTLFENTSDNFLDSLSYTQSGRMKSTLGSFSRTRNNITSQRGGKIQLQKGIAIRDKAIASRVFLHEFGHAGYYQILSADERAVVDSVYRSMSKADTRLFFSEGTGDNPNYHAKDPQEFFAESFAEYILANKVPAPQMEPLLKKVARKFFEGMKRLVNRKNHEAVDRLKPVYEKILAGDKTTPLSEFSAQEPPSFNAELQKLMNQTKSVPSESIFPSGAVQNQQIEPQEGLSPMEQIEISAAPSIQQLPFDFQPEPLQKVIEGDKRTPLKERIRWIDYLRTPWRVFERMGIKANYLELLKGYTNYVIELPKNIDKITAWSKQVGKESNERIFRFLDGEKIELNPQEAKVAGEIKDWLRQWADRLGMAPDARISSYITHIFPQGSKGEIPEEIAYLINKKIPGQVYDPYLLQREGAEGYIKDTWKALDAYVKRATRKVNMDPALASLKEASAQLTDTSQLNYLNRYIGAVNLRPTELDTSIDNHIKEKFGYMFGVRPTSSLTRQARQMIARAKIGGSVTSFAKNLTQGVNTFAELGTQYTVRGYMDLVKFGAKELHENGVLIAPFLEDQTYSAIKKFAERFDKVLFLNMNASELVNRGAAYYGAKAKYLSGNITPKEISKALGKEVTKDYTPNMEDAVAYGKFVAAKTQFQFGALDTPVALNSDIAKTFAQFQTFGLKQAEFIGSMANEREYAKLFRYILSSMLLFTYIGGAFGMKWDDSFKTLRFGMPPVIQFLIDIWGQGIVGEDKYGNKLTPGERVKSVGKSLFTNVVPAGAQISRGIEGFQAVNAGKSTTKSGDFQYKIAKTPMNYVKGTLFGKYNLPEAKAFTKSKDAPAKSGTSRKRF